MPGSHPVVFEEPSVVCRLQPQVGEPSDTTAPQLRTLPLRVLGGSPWCPGEATPVQAIEACTKEAIGTYKLKSYYSLMFFLKTSGLKNEGLTPSLRVLVGVGR